MNNCCLIILLLLFCGQNGNRSGQSGCGCGERNREERQNPSGRRSEPSCNRPDPEPCGCEDSRFEPRFEQRPFNGNGSTCGCEGEGN